jgi:branched-chain amino acid transport system permease protein
MAIRDAEIGAEICGVNTSAMKMMSFAISAVLAGAAGSLYAHTMRFISPEFFGLGLTTTLLAMVLIGGRGTVVGPVVGAALLIVLPEVLRFVKDYYLIAFGIAIWLCVIGMPDGLAGLGRRFLKRARLVA